MAAGLFSVRVMLFRGRIASRTLIIFGL
jgi:hypothetical protein